MADVEDEMAMLAGMHFQEDEVPIKKFFPCFRVCSLTQLLHD